MQSAPSFTAETMALQRSFESHRPRRDRLFTDPYADAFLRPTLRVVALASGVPLLRHAVFSVYDSVGGPGPRPSAIVRTRVIDDAVSEARRTYRQCVILGAGYDTRAHRLAALAGCRVFEVDHPATQTRKRAVVDRLGLRNDLLTWVAVDFGHDDLEAALVAAGFDRSSPSLFVWEGVTQYLPREAVQATLAVLRRAALGGGLLIVTYVDARALHAPSPFVEAAPWVKTVARAGEPWIFGLLPEEAGGFFAAAGLSLRQDTSVLEAGETLVASRPRPERGSGLYRIALVEIPAAPGR